MAGWLRHSDSIALSAPFGRLPPCGRSSLSSIFSWASARLRNQWAFGHSARKRLLKASMNALSVGFPGREKSSVMQRWQAHRSKSREMRQTRCPGRRECSTATRSLGRPLSSTSTTSAPRKLKRGSKAGKKRSASSNSSAAARGLVVPNTFRMCQYLSCQRGGLHSG
jgi:hypothetical protein